MAEGFLVSGYATGQWTGGALSGASTQTTTRSVGELLYFYTPKTQPYIEMSTLFTNKALATGVLVPTATGGFISENKQAYALNPSISFTEEALPGITTQPKTATVAIQDTLKTLTSKGGTSLLPILLVGAAILLLGGKKL